MDRHAGGAASATRDPIPVGTRVQYCFQTNPEILLPAEVHSQGSGGTYQVQLINAPPGFQRFLENVHCTETPTAGSFLMA